MTDAAIINNRGEVIFAADVPEGTRVIEIAGATTRNGAPVNRYKRRVSRSKKNLKKARCCDELVRRTHGDLVFYTNTRPA